MVRSFFFALLHSDKGNPTTGDWGHPGERRGDGGKPLPRGQRRSPNPVARPSRSPVYGLISTPPRANPPTTTTLNPWILLVFRDQARFFLVRVSPAVIPRIGCGFLHPYCRSQPSSG